MSEGLGEGRLGASLSFQKKNNIVLHSGSPSQFFGDCVTSQKTAAKETKLLVMGNL